MHRTLSLLVLAATACVPSETDKDDTDTADTDATADTQDTADTSDSADTADTSDSADTDDTADTSDTDDTNAACVTDTDLGDTCPSDPAATLGALCAIPASTAWDGLAETLLLACFDTSTSDAIDSKAEVDAIPCGVWDALEAASQQYTPPTAFLDLYGFSSGLYAGDELGFDASIKADVVAAVGACP